MTAMLPLHQACACPLPRAVHDFHVTSVLCTSMLLHSFTTCLMLTFHLSLWQCLMHVSYACFHASLPFCHRHVVASCYPSISWLCLVHASNTCCHILSLCWDSSVDPIQTCTYHVFPVYKATSASQRTAVQFSWSFPIKPPDSDS